MKRDELADLCRRVLELDAEATPDWRPDGDRVTDADGYTVARIAEHRGEGGPHDAPHDPARVAAAIAELRQAVPELARALLERLDE